MVRKIREKPYQKSEIKKRPFFDNLKLVVFLLIVISFLAMFLVINDNPEKRAKDLVCLKHDLGKCLGTDLFFTNKSKNIIYFCEKGIIEKKIKVIRNE